MTSLIEFKKQAKILRDFLGQKNHDITHSSCLEAIAIMNGFKNWNTMSGIFAKNGNALEKRSKTWICDTCGGLIQKPEEGWVEWIVSVPKNEAYGLRLAHRAGYGSNGSSCQYNEELVYKQYGGIINDGELSWYLGDGGLMLLLTLLEEQQIPQDQVLEMIKRLHIPEYEHARRH
ncbi:TPA: hypothetical protein JBE77_15060, partial [Legionella pneumophila]|nr:hypothetical protein [Legionella pneumophila]